MLAFGYAPLNDSHSLIAKRSTAVASGRDSDCRIAGRWAPERSAQDTQTRTAGSRNCPAVRPRRATPDPVHSGTTLPMRPDVQIGDPAILLHVADHLTGNGALAERVVPVDGGLTVAAARGPLRPLKGAGFERTWPQDLTRCVCRRARRGRASAAGRAVLIAGRRVNRPPNDGRDRSEPLAVSKEGA